MPNSENNYQAWLLKAEEDEFAGKQILSGNRFAAPACFHFEQMAEKCLKALLIFFGREFPKTHDVVALAALLKPLAPEVENYRVDIEFLNHYYVETRYPGDYPEFTLTECQKAHQAAVRIKEFVLERTRSSR